MDASFWNERYAAEHFVYGEEPNAFVAEHAGQIPHGPVLCLAEGEGRNAVYLAYLGHPVTAVDQSEVGLAKAQRLAAKRGVAIDTIHADLTHYDIVPGKWPGIVLVFAHLPQPARRAMHRTAAEGLSPGGVIILEAYTPAQLALGTGGPKDPRMCVTLDELREDFDGLELLVAREVERDIREGTFHTGRGAVVQAVARKAEDYVRETTGQDPE